MFADFRYAGRMLTKQPGFSVIAILALALGIGPNTAVFSLVNAVLLRPLAYADSDRLMEISSSAPQRGIDHDPISFTKFQIFREQQRVFSEIAAATKETVSVTVNDEPRRTSSQRVTFNFFQVLGLRPALGRNFLPEEDQPGGAPVVLLSHGSWQRRFGGDPNIVGQRIEVSGIPHDIIGVLPNSLAFPFQQAEVWRPRVFERGGFSPERVQRGAGFLQAIGRLKPGISVKQADEELSLLSRRYALAFPDQVDTDFGVAVRPLREAFVADIRPAFLLLLGAVSFVLLIACANVANLFLARLAGRQREVAVRMALGASRRRIIRQFMMESLLLVILSAVVALVFAWGILQIFVSVGGSSIPRVAEISLDPSVLAFGMGISLLTACLLGLFPSIQASRTNINEALQEASRGAIGSGKNARFRNALIAIEVSLSLVLLIGATLLSTSFRKVQKTSPGFKPDHLFVAVLALPPARYTTSDQEARFFQELLSRLESSTEARKCGAITSLPFSEDIALTTYAVADRPQPRLRDRPLAVYHSTSDDYFATMEIPFVQGRAFNQHDNWRAAKVVIINETFARQVFANQNPIGQHILTGVQNDAAGEIVGVVRDVRLTMRNEPARAEIYLPIQQQPALEMMVVVRTATDPSLFGRTILSAVRSIDQGAPIVRTATMAELMSEALTGKRLSIMLLGFFSLIALGLTVGGIYSVISYNVSQRTNELGVRMALGANSADIFKLIIRQGMQPVVIGLVVGMIVALVLMRLLTAVLYDVTSYDPLLLTTIVMGLTLIALLACFFPARRAARTPPMQALRHY